MSPAPLPAILLALAALLPRPLLLPPSPEGWEPFPSRREVSPGGAHYVVLRAEGGGAVRFELARRREGAPPIPPARSLPPTARPGTPQPDIGRDPGDALLAGGTLPQPPFQVRVLDRRPGAVLFERYGGLGGGDALALLDGEGRIAWRLGLGDLFREEAAASFPRVGRDVIWFQAWWVDEERGRIVLAVQGDRFGEVDLADGKVRASDAAVLRTRLREGPEGDRLEAWDLAARLRPAGSAEDAAPVAADPAEPPGIRLRAALLLRREGLPSPAERLFREAAPRSAPLELRTFAWRWLGEVLGEGAIPLLREALRGEDDGAWREAMAGFADVGEAAVPTLLAMLGEKDQPLDYRGGAAGALAAIGSAKALDALWRAAGEFDPAADEFHFVPGSALEAAIALRPADLRGRLLEMLAKGTPLDGKVAGWFAENPGADAVGPLLAMAERWERFTWERKRALAALRACTGKDAGEDPKAWRALVEGAAPGERPR